jgi:hypothetical protein
VRLFSASIGNFLLGWQLSAGRELINDDRKHLWQDLRDLLLGQTGALGKRANYLWSKRIRDLIG